MILEHLHGEEGVKYYGWTGNKQKMIFSLPCYDDILNFIHEQGIESAYDYSTICQDGTVLNLHLEDDPQHKFIKKDGEQLAIYKDHVYEMHVT